MIRTSVALAAFSDAASTRSLAQSLEGLRFKPRKPAFVSRVPGIWRSRFCGPRHPTSSERCIIVLRMILENTMYKDENRQHP